LRALAAALAGGSVTARTGSGHAADGRSAGRRGQRRPVSGAGVV